jgi:hypothetical protein
MPGSLQRRNVPFVKVQQRFVTIMTSDLAGTRTSSPSSMEVDGRRTDKRGSVFSALFPHTVLSYQNAAGVRYTPPRRRIVGRIRRVLATCGSLPLPDEPEQTSPRPCQAPAAQGEFKA